MVAAPARHDADARQPVASERLPRRATFTQRARGDARRLMSALPARHARDGTPTTCRAEFVRANIDIYAFTFAAMMPCRRYAIDAAAMAGAITAVFATLYHAVCLPY